jgi:hypothetical protein
MIGKAPFTSFEDAEVVLPSDTESSSLRCRRGHCFVVSKCLIHRKVALKVTFAVRALLDR